MIKSTKQKYSQHDLRRLMQEQKNKASAASKAPKTRIDSPLAKYNDLGQLTCVLCQSVVRSEDVWKVHINAKQHKDNVTKAKELKERAERQAAGGGMKRPAPPSADVSAVPEKKPKGILKNSNAPVVSVNTKIPENAPQSTTVTPMEVTTVDGAGGVESEQPVEASDTALPEGFFDDPKKDAIARNLEYKDPVQEEWDRFQKEIRDAALESNDIIAEDQEESTAERQIVEIDEQMRNWDRVLAMEKKKEERLKQLEAIKQRQGGRKKVVEIESEEEEEDDQEVIGDGGDEFGSWRAKGWNKK